jgi:hypothetical protein
VGGLRAKLLTSAAERIGTPDLTVAVVMPRDNVMHGILAEFDAEDIGR